MFDVQVNYYDCVYQQATSIDWGIAGSAQAPKLPQRVRAEPARQMVSGALNF